MILPTKIITNPHRIIMGVFFMLSTLDSPAQSSNDDDYFTEVLRTTKNFYEIEKKVEQYYRNKDKGKGSGYKQWKRWQYFYKKRLMPDGTVPNLGAIEMQELDKTRLVKITSKSSQTTANWTNINCRNTSRRAMEKYLGRQFMGTTYR